MTTPVASPCCVPDGLASLNQWIVWKRVCREDRNGKPSIVKLPIDAKVPCGRVASSTDPATWAPLTAAQAALACGRYAGLGFVFAAGGELFGIDLDNCVATDGEVSPWACEILEAFPTYAEVSPSGAGIKLYGIGAHQQKGVTAWMSQAVDGQKRPRVEVYGWGRYFAFTGQRWPDAPLEVADGREPLAKLVARLKAMSAPTPPERPTSSPTASVTLAAKYLAKVPPTKCGTASCHNRTFFAACRLVLWFGLSSSAAMPLLAEWAGRGEHRWTDRELEHKLGDAARKAG